MTTTMRYHRTTYGFALLFVFWITYTAAFGWNLEPQPGTGEVWFDRITVAALGLLIVKRWKLVRRDA